MRRCIRVISNDPIGIADFDKEVLFIRNSSETVWNLGKSFDFFIKSSSSVFKLWPERYLVATNDKIELNVWQTVDKRRKSTGVMKFKNFVKLMVPMNSPRWWIFISKWLLYLTQISTQIKGSFRILATKVYFRYISVKSRLSESSPELIRWFLSTYLADEPNQFQSISMSNPRLWKSKEYRYHP